MPVPASPVRVVLRSRFFRAAFLAMVLSGISVSATAPQLTLFLVRELHTPLPVAGLYYLTNLAAPVAGYLVGRLSDRSPDRLRWFRLCVVVGAGGWLAMAGATVVWLPFVISTVALSVAGASMAQLFAASRDELSRRPTLADNRVMALIRMAFTGGWVIGPVLGSWLGGVVGLRPLLVATALCTLAQLLPLGRQRVDRHVGPPVGPARPERRRVSEMRPLLLFTGVCVLMMTGDTIKFGYLPIFMADQLRISDAERGMVIAVQPLLEFLLLPLAAWLADRFGPLRVMAAGAALGVAANVAYAASTTVAGLVAGQALTAGLWACLAGLGVSVAQRLYPAGVATASGVFLSSMPLSSAVGGATGAFGVAAIGLPHVFWIPAALTAAAAVALLAMSGRSRDAAAVRERGLVTTGTPLD